MERVWESSLGPSRKLVALSYANSAHDEDNRAWASLAYLERRTGLDRKTIIAAITALEAAGILTDTGDRRGKTNSIKVYAVAVPETELHSSTETGEKQSQNSQEAVPFFPGSSTENGTQRRTGDVPETNRKPSARLNGERQELETRFARFWEVYPRKVAKVAAFRAWMKLTPGDAQLEDMLADVLDRCRSPDWLKDNGAYIPHPATYLNGKRWEDCVTDLKGKP